MRDIEFINAKTPEEFAVKYRSTCRKIAQIGTVVDQYMISPTQAHIFYEFEEPDEEVNAYCCDCHHYEWGKRCTLTGCRAGLKDPACQFFNIPIEEGGVQ